MKFFYFVSYKIINLPLILKEIKICFPKRTTFFTYKFKYKITSIASVKMKYLLKLLI